MSHLTLRNIEYSEAKVQEAFGFAEGYKKFSNEVKTEREAVRYSQQLAESMGYKNGFEATSVKAGDKIYFINRHKNIALIHIGSENIQKGVNIVAAHVDAPRLDLKPMPLYESADMALLRTHYYGGIKKYQWVNTPLALHGVVVLKDGTTKEIRIGYDDEDPIFVIPDILPHLSANVQNERKATETIKGEELQLLAGSMPKISLDNSKEQAKHPIKLAILEHLHTQYGMTEEDFCSAEIEVVPALEAQDIGFDRSMIGAYAHDDRMCSYSALQAILNLKHTPKRTAMVFLADKEEIGSTGSTGMESDFFVYALAKTVKALGFSYDATQMMELLWNSKALSADVDVALNPNFKGVHDESNAPVINKGITIAKYTGSGGKYMGSEADSEFVAALRQLLTQKGIPHQFGEMGKIDEGGGGTVAQFLAHRGVQVVDCGGPVMGMHAPMELISKIDLFSNYETYHIFLEEGL
ncbi:aminopeptidase [Entomospira culicis]|uniref:M18 family aminopeptidase n=1 Tax=Entomospira culicis TaxID=2719989 RepID=A0A968GJK4_9SPIO|nr:aminopeptidase [Entomospira culicis]NIZ19656.1 aminopeptidase [Entomospira culicis]NIZ69870.1 aminopeptidase [Entomospira culicis]WDI36975.1 aminopeptidase [Entomospira culicis]WDI38604.1 aminopeptidase [Entomospira culicis]